MTATQTVLDATLCGVSGAMKIHLACGVAIAGLMVADAAWAQESAAAAPDGAEIVVTGSLLSRTRAAEQKRLDDRVIEVLGADDLGQFPDRNIGESLNRLPGVTMLVEKGEGRYVQLRGLAANLNNVTINGLQMGSPEVEDGGRQAPLDIISAGVLNRVEVVKTHTADMDGQGIGGTVNIVTQMPFDRPDALYGQVSGRIGYESERPRDNAYGGHDPWAVDGMISGKTADDRFGWLIGGTYSKREYVSVGIFQDDWEDVDGTQLPVNVKNNYYIIGRKRLNLNGALEFRPTTTDQYFLRGFYAEWNEFQHRNRYEQAFSAGVVAETPTSGVSGPNRVQPNIRLENADKKIFSLAGGGRNDLGALTLDYVLQYNENTIAEPNDFWEWRSGAIFGPNSWTLADNGVVTITPDAGTPDRQDPALFPLRRVRFTESDMTEKAIIGQFDASYDLGMVTLKGGLKAAETKRDFDFNRTQFDQGEDRLTLATADFTNGAFVNEVPAGNAPNLLMDIDAMNAFFANPANASFFDLNENVQLANDFSSDYAVRETILAGYGMASYKTDSVDVIGGLRVERTEVNSSGFLLADGTASEISSGGDYTSWLPSLIVNWRPDDRWVVRGGITRSLGRPGYNTIAPRSTFSQVSDVVGRLSVGNPGLQARSSWNFDASVEFYPTASSAFAVALFRKEIDKDFVSQTSTFRGEAEISQALEDIGFAPGTVDISGLERLDVSTTINAGSTTIEGLELSGQLQLDMLPSPLDGIGISGNATFINGNTRLTDGSTIVVQGQPKQAFAASLFYQKYGFDASLSYKWNASFPTDLNDDPDLNLDQGAFGRIDARLAYNFNKQLRVFIEGINLNNEPTSEFQGGDVQRNTEYEYVGRTFYFGVSYGF